MMSEQRRSSRCDAAADDVDDVDDDADDVVDDAALRTTAARRGSLGRVCPSS